MALDTTAARSRRALLVGGLGALTAVAAQALGRAAPVSAGGDPVILGIANSTTNRTAVTNTTSGGTGLWGVGQGQGSTGVRGEGEFAGVSGDTSSGYGVKGTATQAGGVGVYGSHIGMGNAIVGELDSSTSGYGAIYGKHGGRGPGVFGENLQDGNGVSGVARGPGSGVYAQSDKGRGGTFVGKKAQLKLQPSAAASHPTSGERGDLFVDRSGRLWFCKGATTWVKLA